MQNNTSNSNVPLLINEIKNLNNKVNELNDKLKIHKFNHELTDMIKECHKVLNKANSILLYELSQMKNQ